MKQAVIQARRKNGYPIHYRLLNEEINDAAEKGYGHIIIKNALGQRYIAAGMDYKVKIDVHGVAGNDLGAFMSGPTIEVFGNAEDQAGNTMNAGKIIIHGNAWDVTALAARGGKIFVKGDGGYRIGIHMKEYMDYKPVLVYGGRVKEFFGEYLAGGILVALGFKFKNDKISNVPKREVVGSSLASGIHGGVIYIRGEVPESYLGVGAAIQEFTKKDRKELRPILEEWCRHFKVPIKKVWDREFTKIVPTSHRPYGGYYCSESI